MAPSKPGPAPAFDVHYMGGAFGRVPEEATPFSHRAAQFWSNSYGSWPDAADDAHRIALSAAARRTWSHSPTGPVRQLPGLEPAGHRGFDPRRVVGPAEYRRLVGVKRHYDPANLFHANQNIPPE